MIFIAEIVFFASSLIFDSGAGQVDHLVGTLTAESKIWNWKVDTQEWWPLNWIFLTRQ